MKQLQTAYTISGSAITLTGLNAPLERILLIADATSGKVLYSMAGPAPSSYTQAVSSVLTTSVAPDSNSDKLTIFYEDGVSPASVTVNNAASQVFNYTATGAVAGSPVIIPSIDCGQFREVSVQIVSSGTGFSLQGQISNDGTNWILCPAFANNGNVSLAQFSGAQIYTYTLSSAKFFRVIQPTAQTAGTTTLVAYASQQPTPKLYQTITGSVTATPNTGTAPQSPSSYISLAGTNALVISAGASNFFALFITNTTAFMKYVKVYNRGTLPTIGTDVPTWTIGIPPMATIDISNGFAGARFLSGISIGITGGYAVTDTTAVAAGDVIVNWLR